MTSSEGNSQCVIRGKQKQLVFRSDEVIMICYIAHFAHP